MRRTWAAAVAAATALACKLGSLQASAADLETQHRRLAEALDSARFDAALTQTGDGSRAYEYAFWVWMDQPRSLRLYVRPDGSATLTGAVPQPAELDADTVRPLEAAVASAGFPDFPRVEDELCFDGAGGLFRAAVRGRQGTAISNNCGDFDAPVDAAARMLFKMAEAHGGVLPSQGRELQDVPIDIKVFTAKDARRARRRR